MFNLRLFIPIAYIFVFTVLSDAAILLDRVVAVVNKEVITWSEVYRMMEFEAADQVKALKEDEKLRLFKEDEEAFLQKLIDMRLQIQEAKRIGLEVTPEELTEAIDNIKKKYSMTQTSFMESLQKEGLTIEEYKRRLSEQILIGKVINQQIRNKIVISEDDLKKYLEKNRQIFGDAEVYKLRQIFLRRQKNVDDRTIEERASLIVEKLKAGKDFSVLAKEFSEDPSGKGGGELGLIKKGLLAKEFVDILSTIKRGDFSRPFWTEKGLHIIKLDEIISMQNADQIKEEARRYLTEQQFAGKYKSWLKGLRERSFIEIRL
ncbi:MAG: peptidylprolyl isomerase [Nitrospirota bacterium]